MKIQELFVRLSENEFANLNLGHDGNGCIADADLNKVIHALNGVLTNLHKKYLLRVNTHTLITTGTMLEYQLNIPNLIKFLQAYLVEEGLMLPINDGNFTNQVVTYSSGKILVPQAGTYNLTYQENYPLINKTNLNQELSVPQVLITPICYWVAHSVYGSMNSVENLNVSMNYLNKYNTAIMEIDMQDSLGDSRIDNNPKFVRNGWI